MQFAPRLAFVAAVTIIAVTAACGGDSTGPGDGGTRLRLSRAFDSLYVQAKAQSTSDTMFQAFARSHSPISSSPRRSARRQRTSR